MFGLPRRSLSTPLPATGMPFEVGASDHPQLGSQLSEVQPIGEPSHEGALQIRVHHREPARGGLDGNQMVTDRVEEGPRRDLASGSVPQKRLGDVSPGKAPDDEGQGEPGYSLPCSRRRRNSGQDIPGSA